MNDLVRIAQSGGASSPGSARIRLTKPADGSAQVIQVTPGLVLDLQGIAAQDVVMVRAGDRLVILFSDQSAVVLAGFYGSDGRPVSGIDVDLGQGATIPAAQLAAVLPVSDDTSILPASGPASPGGSPLGSSFQSSTVTPDALGGGSQALDLLSDDSGAPNPDFAREARVQVNNVAVLGGEVAGEVVEDGTTEVAGVLTVSDADGETQVVAQAGTAGAYGAFFVDASGAWRYVLDNSSAAVQALGEGDTRTERFEVVSIDQSATETIVITITGANDLPLLGGVGLGAVNEDRALSTTGALTIVDVDTGESQFASRTDVAGLHGRFSVDATGAWTYVLDNDDPAVQALGVGRTLTESFIVRSVDGSAETVVTVTINGTNDVPVVTDGAGSVSEDGVLTGAVIGTDIDGDPLTYATVGDVPEGLIFNSDGTWSYTPPESYRGLDDGETADVTFLVRADDGFDVSDAAPVTITITGANDAPVAQDREATVSEDGTLTGPAVIATDVDVEDLTYAIVGDAPAGLTFNDDGSWSYVPPEGHQALDDGESNLVTFRYRASDGTADSNVATVTITVTGANDAPMAPDGDATVSEDGTLAGQAVTANDVDVEDLTYAIVGDRPEGLTFHDDGTWSYVPPEEYQGLDDGESATVTFQYKANDGTVDSAAASVTITITGSNDAPEAYSSPAVVSEDGILTGQAVMATDADGDPLTYAIVGTAPDGLTFNDDGTWSYTPPESFQDLDDGEQRVAQFRFKANDGTADSNVAMVTVTITGANDAPVAQGSDATVSEDGTLTGQVTATDVDVEDLAYAIVGDQPEGLTFHDDGTWSYTPPAIYQGLDDGESATVTFRYKANDSTVDSNVATVTITISGANDTPVAENGTAFVSEDEALTGQAVTATDGDGDTLTYSLVGTVPEGLIFNDDGTWSYDPPNSFQNLDTNEYRTATFRYKVNDGTSDSNVATVTITVAGRNDAPVAPNVSAMVSEDSTLAGQTFAATDVDVEALTYSIVGTPPAGVTLNANGTWSFSPTTVHQGLDDNETSTVTFQYRAYDGTAYSDPATVTIMVTGANDAPVAQNGSAGVFEGGVLSGRTVTATDADVETLAYTLVGDAPAGLSFNNGTWSYTVPSTFESLPAGQTATVTFQWVASDGTTTSNVATQTITVTGTDDAPVAAVDSGIMTEDQDAVVFNVLANDRLDPDAGATTTLAVGSISIPAGAFYGLDASDIRVTVTSSGLEVTLLGADWEKLSGSSTLGVTIWYTLQGDKPSSFSSSQLALTITGVNDAPVLDTSKTLTLTVAEDAASPSGTAVGTLISQLIDPAGGGGNDNYADVDGFGLYGIAITNINASQGTWYYQAEGNSGWSFINAASITPANALLLPSTYKLYFKPNANYSGTIDDAITFRAWDRSGGTQGSTVDTTANGGSTRYSAETETISVTVTGSNDAPTVTGLTNGTVAENAVGAVIRTFTVADVDSPSGLTFRVLDASGAVDPRFVVTAAPGTTPGQPGSYQLRLADGVSLDYEAEIADGSAAIALKVEVDDHGSANNLLIVPVTVTVTDVAEYRPPVAQDKSVSVTEDTTLTGQSVTATDPDGNPLSYGLVSARPDGLTFNANGTWSYLPPASMQELGRDEARQVTFQYKALDSSLAESNVATVTITVAGVNDGPVAQNAAASVSEDGLLTGQAVTATDIDGDTLTYTRIGGAVPGLTFNADGSWSFDPTAHEGLDDGERATVKFQYKASDGLVESVAEVTITVLGANDAPNLTNLGMDITEDGLLTGAFAPQDVDGDVLTYELTSTAPEGLTFADGDWQYDPRTIMQHLDDGESELVSFSYRAFDGDVYSNTATFTITVHGSNDAPDAQDQSVSMSEDGVLVGQAVTATDVDDEPLRYELVGNRPDGLTFNTDGTWSYVPPSSLPDLGADEIRLVRFQYKANDGTVDSDTATVTIRVEGINRPPVASGGSATVSEDDTLLGQSISATDPDGQTLSYALYGTGTVLGLTFNSNGTWSYAPPPSMHDLDTGESRDVTFQYRAYDGSAYSDPATVTITVSGANDAPVAQSGMATVAEGGELTGKAVIATDVDGDPLTYTLDGNQPEGLIFNNDGTWSYKVPASFEHLPAGQNATVTFQYKAYDGTTYSEVATQTITIAGANDLPIAKPDDVIMTEGQGTTVFDVRANDTLDVDDGAANTISVGFINVYFGEAYGITKDDIKVEVNAGKLEVTLLGTDWDKISYVGSVTFTVNYNLHGNGNEYASNQLTVQVRGVNDASVLDASKTPVITVDEDAAAPTAAVVGTLVSNLLDPEGGGGLDNFKDVDGTGFYGMAITGVNASHGTWYYRASEGGGWTAINPADVSPGHALLLAFSYSLYFKPAADFSGTIDDAITFRSWDRISGTPGLFADTTTNGGSSQFSADTDMVRVTVNPVNDRPTISGLTGLSVAENQADAKVGTFTVSDIDSASSLTFRVLNANGHVDSRFVVVAASGTTSGQPGNYEVRLAAGQSLDFEAENADGNPTISLTVEVDDHGGSSNTHTATMVATVTNVIENTAPVVEQFRAGAVNEDGFITTLFRGTDADGDALTYTFVGDKPDGLTNNGGRHLTGTDAPKMLTGTDGDDILLGGLGADILVGELGADVFAYTATAQGGDTIRDFVSGDDTISVLNSILGTSDTGLLDLVGSSANRSPILFEGIGSATAAAQNNSAKLLYDTSGHSLYYDSDGGASASGRILLAHLENGSVLEASDIRLVSA